MIKIVRRGGVKEEEKDRMETRKRNSDECLFMPCRDWPTCRREKRCKYMHTGK